MVDLWKYRSLAAIYHTGSDSALYEIMAKGAISEEKASLAIREIKESADWAKEHEMWEDYDRFLTMKEVIEKFDSFTFVNEGSK